MPSRFVPNIKTPAARQTPQRAPAPGAHERETRRTPHRVPCRLRVFDPSTGAITAVCGQTVNISADGLAVWLNTDVPTGTWVEALVPRLEGAPLCLSGTVVRSRRVLTGTFEVGIGLTAKVPAGAGLAR
ncbi:MAG: PilZ domain-containing protein [Planctomycetes bacterium]|nr:PilZ domain-containing protein [Planctomycetota bacterium]